MLRPRYLVVWSMAVLLFTGSILAEETPPADKPSLAVGQADIEKALGQPVQMEFAETPLSDVVDYLKETHCIETQLDRRALIDVGIGTDTPITIHLNGVSLHSALNLMLRELGLTWTIQDEVLLITTPEEAESILFTKVYDVADLVECRDSHNEIWSDYRSLIEAIRLTVTPTAWNEAGGPAAIAPAEFGAARGLLVSHTYQGHCEIADMLKQVREIAKKTQAEPPRRDREPVEPRRIPSRSGRFQPGSRGS